MVEGPQGFLSLLHTLEQNPPFSQEDKTAGIDLVGPKVGVPGPGCIDPHVYLVRTLQYLF